MLDDAAIERYARQIVVPEIGAAGQERLLRSTVVVVGDPRGVATAGLYLRAAGVRVVEWDGGGEVPGFDVALMADIGAVAARVRDVLLAGDSVVCWYVATETGYRSAVHPEQTPTEAVFSPYSDRSTVPAALHDAAACDCAALACARLVALVSGTFLGGFEF